MCARPFIPVANCASIELIYSTGGLVFENVLHIQKGSDYSLADLQAVRTIVDNWDNTTWKAYRGGAYSLTRIKTKALHSASAPFEEYQLATPRTGTDAAATLPPHNTWCVKLASNLAGRSYRGRLYTVGMTTGMLLTGSVQVNTTYANGVVTALNTLKTNLNTGGHTLVVVSYRADKAWRAAGVATAISTITYADLNIDSQRRRLAGRGRT